VGTAAPGAASMEPVIRARRAPITPAPPCTCRAAPR